MKVLSIQLSRKAELQTAAVLSAVGAIVIVHLATMHTTQFICGGENGMTLASTWLHMIACPISPSECSFQEVLTFVMAFCQ